MQNGIPRMRSTAYANRMSPVIPQTPHSAAENGKSSRVLLFLTSLPIILAFFAFSLHWSSGDYDPRTTEKLYDGNSLSLPGWQLRSHKDKLQAHKCSKHDSYSGAVFPHQKWSLDVVRFKNPRVISSNNHSEAQS